MAGHRTASYLLGSTQVAVDLLMAGTAITTVLAMARRRRQEGLRPLETHSRASQKTAVRAHLVQPSQPTLGAAVEAGAARVGALEARDVLLNAWGHLALRERDCSEWSGISSRLDQPKRCANLISRAWPINQHQRFSSRC